MLARDGNVGLFFVICRQLINFVSGFNPFIFVVVSRNVARVFLSAKWVIIFFSLKCSDIVHQIIRSVIMGLLFVLLNIVILLVLRQRSRILFLKILCLAIIVYLFCLIFG